MTVKLYTTHCPRCKVIEKKLTQKEIEYTEITDQEEMIKLGFKSAPVLEVDDKILNFGDANRWIMNYIKE